MKILALRRFWPSMRKSKLSEIKRKRLISSGNEEQGHSPPTMCEIIGKDRISNLPDEVLHTIVSLLSTKEAVRTSILSRRWRNMYAYTSNLEFDWRDVLYLPVQVRPHGTIFRRYVDYFLATLDRLLACHLGPKVVSFKVFCFFPSMYVLQVNDWIDFAIRKGVEDLDLAFTCDNQPKCTVWSSFDYFPAQILLNDEESKLRRLSLRECILKSNFNIGFRTLSTLVLCDVNLAGHVEPHMFSSCLNLEHLTLQRCLGLERLCIGDSLQCLKALVVIRCEGLKGIELNATNLTNFHYKGYEMEFSFEMVPNLEEVYVMMPEIYVVPTYARLEKQLPHVKTLAVVRDWAY